MKIYEMIGKTIKCIECNKEYTVDYHNARFNGFCSSNCLRENINGRIMAAGGMM